MKFSTFPSWLIRLTILSILLRFGLGIFWQQALPAWGYGGDSEVAGYIMADAYERDTTAWELAQSDESLGDAFTERYDAVDQYGGLLFLSAVVYRYLGGDAHQPLMMVALAALVSSLSLIFVWAFAHRLWGERVAKWAAWMLAFYPEAMLLGSSQMREAFTITLAAATMYSLTRMRQEHNWRNSLWVVGALLLSIPLSPAFTMMLTLSLLLLAVALWRGQWLRDRRLWIALGALLILGVAGVGFFGARLADASFENPLAYIQYWIERTSLWQKIASTQVSGWMTKLFENVPYEFYTWVILVYGVVQPFLPAALIAGGNPLWRGIAIWRALGWTLLLPLLIYAPLRALRQPRRWLILSLSLASWMVILSASFRSGGDQWDNPRYRAAFAGMQIVLAAWLLVEHRQNPDPWFRRVLVGVGLVLAWFLPWYLHRYLLLEWVVLDVFKTFGLGIASAVLYWIWDWARLHRSVVP